MAGERMAWIGLCPDCAAGRAALARTLDGLRPKPEPPQVWRWRFDMHGAVSWQKWPSAAECRGYAAKSYGTGTPVRETVDPTTGVVTLTPEKEGV